MEKLPLLLGRRLIKGTYPQSLSTDVDKSQACHLSNYSPVLSKISPPSFLERSLIGSEPIEKSGFFIEYPQFYPQLVENFLHF